MKLPLFNSPQMQTFEQYACDAFGLTVEYMMQEAGNSIADFVEHELITKKLCQKAILVVIGHGNNGGDALVAARLLKERGHEIAVLSPYPLDLFTSSTKQEMGDILAKGIRIFSSLEELGPSVADQYGLIIDGLFGFALEGDPRSPAKEIIEWINVSGLPVLSVDVPSGLDVNTGRLMTPAVRATYTLVLGMPKVGLDVYHDYVGKLFLGSLGIPQRAYEKVGVLTAPFQGSTYVPLH